MTDTYAHDAVPAERRERNPLIDADGWRMLRRIAEHPDAPVWNYFVGDRVITEDLARVDAFRKRLAEPRPGGAEGPPDWVAGWVAGLRDRVPLFRERLPEGMDLQRDWANVETTRREDLAVRPADLVPEGADLSRLIVYDTSGTTGHAVVVPWHPGAVAANHALVEWVLSRYGPIPEFGPGRVAAVNLTARAKAVVFPNVFSVWRQAGFAKVNFHASAWADPARARRFFESLDPLLVTGESLGFSEMLDWGVVPRPRAMISTAVALPPGLKARLEQACGCPVIDWYSVTETGPLAYACPLGNGMHVISPDLYVEIVDPEGMPVEPGRFGEIAVTGGRNPYLPLLRYRTGDLARMDSAPCPCGDASPRLLDFTGRGLVLFRNDSGGVVNQVDIGRLLRETTYVQHAFVQHRDGRCRLRIRPARGIPLDRDGIRKRLAGLLGEGTPLEVIEDPDLGREGKVTPYASEIDAG